MKATRRGSHPRPRSSPRGRRALSSAITSGYLLHQGSPLCQARPWRNPAWLTAGGVSFVARLLGRDQHDVRTLIHRHRREPPAERDRLLLAQATQGDVTAMSICGNPAASAASRATFPALCPWRTIQSLSGQRFCTTSLQERHFISPGGPCGVSEGANGEFIKSTCGSQSGSTARQTHRLSMGQRRERTPAWPAFPEPPWESVEC